MILLFMTEHFKHMIIGTVLMILILCLCLSVSLCREFRRRVSVFLVRSVCVFFSHKHNNSAHIFAFISIFSANTEVMLRELGKWRDCKRSRSTELKSITCSSQIFEPHMDGGLLLFLFTIEIKGKWGCQRSWFVTMILGVRLVRASAISQQH